jgi:hypothetical protein
LLSLVVAAGCREPSSIDDVPTVRPDGQSNDIPNPPSGEGGVDVPNPPQSDGGMDGGPTAREVTVRQLQDIADPGHPAPSSRISVTQPDLVALTGRVLIGSSTGDNCRFAVWVGVPGGGDFSAIQVQEQFPRGAAMTCFAAMPQKISDMIVPGTRVQVLDATYSEFCLAAMQIPMCRDFEQSQIFLGGRAMLVTMGMGMTPTPTTVTAAQVGQTAGGMIGTRTLALEGTLIQLSNVRVNSIIADGGFTNVTVNDPGDATRTVAVQISNFPNTSCVRAHFNTINGMNTTLTGILVPDFGKWTIRLRGETDVQGLSCSRDGGTGMDASRD